MSYDINNKIYGAMESINDINRLSPKPFLLTRINAALKENASQNIWSEIAFYLKKPSIAFIAILLVFVVNVFVITKRNQAIERESVSKKINTQKYDFAINVSVMYDTENQEP